MKKILFPTDFSDAAQNAHDYAFELALIYNLELHFIHAIDVTKKYLSMSMMNSGDPSVPGFEPELILKTVEEEKKSASEKLRKLKENAEEKNITSKVKITTGNMHEDVIEYSKSQEIDIIVMGTHGASGFQEAFIGSNAQKVVRRSPVPVLTIKEIPNEVKFEHVVFASDFIEDEIIDLLPKVKDITSFLGSGLDVVYINTPTHFERTDVSLKRMMTALEKHDVSFSQCEVFNDFDIEDGIVNYANHRDADLIILITHGFSGLKKLFNDNITEAVVNSAKRPVLSINLQS